MSIFMVENRFFGPPKIQEAYNIINFRFLMENSIIKKFGSTKSPLTSVPFKKIYRAPKLCTVMY